MKKRVCGVICGALVLAGACMSMAEDAAQEILYERGREVVSLLTEAVRSEGYVSFYSASEEVNEVLKEAGAAEYGEPEAVYAVTVSDEFYTRVDEGGVLDQLSDELADMVKNKLFRSLIYQIGGYDSSVKLAAASVCNVEKTFAAPEVTENVMYVYTFEDGVPIVVAFTPGEDGAVTASGSLILSDGFAADSTEEVEESFADYAAEVSKIR